MKTIRITFRKPGHTMLAHLKYRTPDHDESMELSGDVDAFLMPDGSKLRPFGNLDGHLEANTHFQAKQVGATAEIEDLGGETVRWINVLDIGNDQN